jgi:hypothetical protein
MVALHPSAVAQCESTNLCAHHACLYSAISVCLFLSPQSSNLQTDKTKHDTSLKDDLIQKGKYAMASTKDAAHKLGVATGLVKPTTGQRTQRGGQMSESTWKESIP